MGFQALHPAQGMRGRQQVVSVVALTAAVFSCSDPEPRAHRTAGAPPWGGLGAVSSSTSPHHGDENLWAQALQGRSRDMHGPFNRPLGSPPGVWCRPGKAPAPTCPRLLHPPTLTAGPVPLAKWGCRDAAHTCQVHTGPAGGLKTSWKATHDSVSSTSIDAHLREMIPTSHLTVILQLIVI